MIGRSDEQTAKKDLPVKSLLFGRSLTSWLFSLLLWALLGILLAVGFNNAAAMVRYYPPVSLRYENAISGQTAYNARVFSVENSAEYPFWPTFWQEKTVALESELTEKSVDAIVYSGGADLVWPTEYIEGAAPGVTDNKGCAISAALAWTLWGSMDVVGKILKVDGEERILRGVFPGEDELILLSYSDIDTTQNWANVELSAFSAGDIRSQATAYAQAAGLGQPSAVIMGSGPVFLAGVLSLLPLLAMGAFALWLLISWLITNYVRARKPLLFGLLIVAGLFLPALLTLLPSWLIPSQWSDFTFWSSLAKQLAEQVREFLSANPRIRDVEGKLLLLRQAVLAIAGLCCAFVVCFRWQHLQNKKASASTVQDARIQGGKNG